MEKLLTVVCFCIFISLCFMSTIYCSKRYAYSIIKQYENCAFHRTLGNQAFVGWGDLDTALRCLCHPSCFCVCFVFFRKWIICVPIYYVDQMQKSLDSFFRRRSLPEICVEEMENWEKQQRRISVISNTTEGFEKECEKEWKNFPPRIKKGIRLATVQWV